ncbi:niban-like protein 2 isoform X4 [Alligator sinensis]|uniref:Niban-like protein 2 isoform X4 n=1 Tax=Alligator sinensis TaxID=38654 RepID=A0A3Q0FQM2_ALLSI|nr:niban-like protein 2 isoform X4 [Alligator sinensis]
MFTSSCYKVQTLSASFQLWLAGCTDAMVKNFMPYYQRQLAAAVLREISRELDAQSKPTLQLLQSQLWKPPNSLLHEGFLTQYHGDSHKWKENYFILLGDCRLECFDSKEAWGKGCEPRESTTLSGYLLVTTWREYTTLVNSLCQGFVGDYSHEDQDPLTDPPTEFLLFLYHPLRKHLCLCTDSAESQHTWKSALQDGIRYCSTVLQRRDNVEVEAFLEAVRFYRQGKGSYKVGDLLLGTEPEILSNVLVEDLLPVLQLQVLPNLRGSENRRRQTWCQFLEEVYMLVLSQISSEFLDFQKEQEKLHIQLEKKIRPDLDQMLTLKDQISRKLQAVVQSPAESCCRQEVEPDLDCVMEELMHPISQGFDMVRSRFVDRVDEMIAVVQSSSTSALQKEFLTLGKISQNPGFMYLCYEKAELYKDSLQGLKERFNFYSMTSLVLGAQNLMQQLMQNSIHTFQQLSEQHLSMANNRNQITQVLEKVKGRVLKKFDYDSSSMRKQFAQEWLLQIFLPFLLKSLEPQCKLELPKYESYVFADFSDIINVENIYEEMVLAILMEAVSKALKKASSQNRHNLYSDSFSCVPDSVDNLQRDAASEMRTGVEGGSAPSDIVTLIPSHIRETVLDVTEWNYEGGCAWVANAPKYEGQICLQVSTEALCTEEKSLCVSPDNRNWRNQVFGPDMQSENNAKMDNLNKNKHHDKSRTSSTGTKNPQEPDFTKECFADKCVAENLQEEWGKVDQGGQRHTEGSACNLAWNKDVGQSSKNGTSEKKQIYEGLVQDLDLCTECGDCPVGGSTPSARNRPASQTAQSGKPWDTNWLESTSVQVTDLAREASREDGNLTDGKLHGTATSHVASIQWERGRAGKNQCGWEMGTKIVDKGESSKGEVCNGQMTHLCPFPVKGTGNATRSQQLQVHSDEMIHEESYTPEMPPAINLETAKNAQQAFKNHGDVDGQIKSNSSAFLITGSLRYEDVQRTLIPEPNEARETACKISQPPEENEEEMLQADFSGTDRTVFLESLSIAIEMEVFQADLLEMDLEDKKPEKLLPTDSASEI